MGREVRRVHKDWQHPKKETGEYIPLFEGYKDQAEEFLTMANEKGLQEAVEYMGCPDKNDYMPDWDESEATHLMMYEDTTEGTPISPAFETPEELAKWLADNDASAFAGQTATYEQWLGMIKAGWAPTAIINSTGCHSGVAAISEM